MKNLHNINEEIGIIQWFGDSTKEGSQSNYGYIERIDNLDTLFQRKARLEVSGIRKGSESIIQSRVKMKLEQISPSDTLSPGYVCVVEFGTPRTRIIEKCKT
jgi:hypothetical protein